MWGLSSRTSTSKKIFEKRTKGQRVDFSYLLKKLIELINNYTRIAVYI